MATITINRAVVNRIFGNDNQGAAVYEEVVAQFGERKGERIRFYYTLWMPRGSSFDDLFDGNGANEGGVLENISGEISVKTESYEDKKTGEERWTSRVAVNDVTIGGGSGSSASDDEDDDWG